jgi:hypothetical protein
MTWVPTKEEAVEMFARYFEACHRSGAIGRARQIASSLEAKGDHEGHKIWTDVACSVEALRQGDRVPLRRAKELT